MTDEEVIEGLRKEREALLLEHPYLALLPLKHTKMRCGNTGVNDNRTDTHDVEFVGRSVQFSRLHRVMMRNELRMRNIVVPEESQSVEL